MSSLILDRESFISFERKVKKVVSNLKEQFDSLLKNLSEKERRILTLRFGLEDGRCHTLAEISEMFGITRERVRQIEAKALRRLRHSENIMLNKCTRGR